MGLGQAEICFCLLEPGGAGGRLELGPHQRILGLQVHEVFIDVVKFALRLQHLLLQILHHLKRAAMLGENADEEGDDAEECLAGWRLLWLSQLAQVGVHVGHLLADDLLINAAQYCSSSTADSRLYPSSSSPSSPL